MKRTLTLVSSVLALSLVSAASAATISGDIYINQFGSPATVDQTANTVSFTPTAPSNNTQVTYRSGDWTSIALGTLASYADFTYSPLSVAGTLGGAVWKVNAGTYFVLSSVTFVDENASGTSLLGMGTAYLTGFDATIGSWSFSADSSGNQFSFSSTTSVPDGGTTALLLGVALVGFGLLGQRKRLA